MIYPSGTALHICSRSHGLARIAPQHAASCAEKTGAGDTLGSIARRQGVSLSALRNVNGIGSDSHHIRVGQKLRLPAGST